MAGSSMMPSAPAACAACASAAAARVLFSATVSSTGLLPATSLAAFRMLIFSSAVRVDASPSEPQTMMPSAPQSSCHWIWLVVAARSRLSSAWNLVVTAGKTPVQRCAIRVLLAGCGCSAVAAGPFHAREFCIQKTSIFVYKIVFIYKGDATALQQGFFTTTQQYIVFIIILHRKRLTKLS